MTNHHQSHKNRPKIGIPAKHDTQPNQNDLPTPLRTLIFIPYNSVFPLKTTPNPPRWHATRPPNRRGPKNPGIFTSTHSMQSTLNDPDDRTLPDTLKTRIFTANHTNFHSPTNETHHTKHKNTLFSHSQPQSTQTPNETPFKGPSGPSFLYRRIAYSLKNDPKTHPMTAQHLPDWR